VRHLARGGLCGGSRAKLRVHGEIVGVGTVRDVRRSGPSCNVKYYGPFLLELNRRSPRASKIRFSCRPGQPPSPNAVNDFGSRIRENLDFSMLRLTTSATPESPHCMVFKILNGVAPPPLWRGLRERARLDQFGSLGPGTLSVQTYGREIEFVPAGIPSSAADPGDLDAISACVPYSSGSSFSCCRLNCSR